MSKIFTSKNYQNLINQKVGTNTPFSKLFKDLRCQIFPLCPRASPGKGLIFAGPNSQNVKFFEYEGMGQGKGT